MRAALDDQRVRVFLFGSRAWGSPRPGSDIGVRFPAERAIWRRILARPCEACEERRIACEVEIVDLREADPELRRRVLQKHGAAERRKKRIETARWALASREKPELAARPR